MAGVVESLELSSINGFDAAENETNKYMSFDNDKWYSFNLKVTDAKIVFTIDEETIIDLDREDKRFDTRIEVIRSDLSVSAITNAYPK